MTGVEVDPIGATVNQVLHMKHQITILTQSLVMYLLEKPVARMLMMTLNIKMRNKLSDILLIELLIKHERAD